MKDEYLNGLVEEYKIRFGEYPKYLMLSDHDNIQAIGVIKALRVRICERGSGHG